MPSLPKVIAGRLEAESRPDHVVREPRGRRNLRIDDDQQLERLERAARLGLVGPGQQRIAADDDQRPHLAVARRQDLVGQRRRRQAGGRFGEAAHAQRLPEPDAGRGFSARATPENWRNSTPRLGSGSPARTQRPQTVLSASTR